MGDVLEGDVELTEFEALDVHQVKGVGKGANGFPILLMKGLAAAAAAEPAEPDAATLAAAAIAKAVTGGQVDEAPDIDLGQQVMRLLGQAIAGEAAEISAGSYGETRDVGMLGRAADLVSCWIAREQATAAGQDPDAPCGCCEWCSGIGCGCCPGCGPGMVMCSAADDAAAKALLSAKEKNDLPDSAFAYIEDGGTKDADGKTTPRSKRHFPIHDKAHADNAMARIEQGAEFGDKAKRKVKAAQAEFGESDDDKGAKSAGTVADEETTVQDDLDGGQIATAVEDAVTKAIGPLQERIATLDAELAKVKAKPIPGGPVLSNAARPHGTQGADGDDQAAKAALYRWKADQATSPADREGYRQLAREADDQAKAALAAT
jgi:hypothetical protein